MWIDICIYILFTYYMCIYMHMHIHMYVCSINSLINITKKCSRDGLDNP